MRRKKILVTGGSGFIGSWLVEELKFEGYEVAVVDNQRPGSSDAIWFEADLVVPGAFEEVAWCFQPHAVIHLAAQVGREFGEDDQIHTIRQNAQISTQVANSCAKYGIKLLYVSSSEIYGDNGSAVSDELFGPFSLPHNLYGLTKRWGEEVCQLYMPDDQLVIVRLSMPYGPGAPPGRGRRAMDNFLWQAHHGMSIPVHRGSERSWCWVGDTVRGIRMALEESAEDRRVWGMKNLTFNIGRDEDPRSMHDLAKYACYLAHASEDLIQITDPPQRQTVVKRLGTDRLREIGWRPTVELEDGMSRVYEYIKNYDAEGNWTLPGRDPSVADWYSR